MVRVGEEGWDEGQDESRHDQTDERGRGGEGGKRGTDGDKTDERSWDAMFRVRM